MRLRTQSAVLDFVDEVTTRYGSLEGFFASLRADWDEQPTEVLPVLRDIIVPQPVDSGRELPTDLLQALSAPVFSAANPSSRDPFVPARWRQKHPVR